MMLSRMGHRKPPMHWESKVTWRCYFRTAVCSLVEEVLILCRYMRKDRIYRCVKLYSFKDVGPLEEM